MCQNVMFKIANYYKCSRLSYYNNYMNMINVKKWIDFIVITEYAIIRNQCAVIFSLTGDIAWYKLWWRIWYTVRSVILLLRCRCLHAKRHVVVQRVIDMSPCHRAYKPVLRFEPSDNVTSRPHAARQRAVWRASLASDGMTRRKSITDRLALCRDIASDNRAHKSVPNQLP
jgi:hypothetical protein